jgi:hypothetical protein
MIRILTISSIFLLVLTADLLAQLYPTVQRPKAVWMEMKTPHFRVLYPDGHHATAIRTGQILEAHVDTLTSYFGSSLRNLPVVVDPFSQVGNGYVTPFPFRIEFQTAPIKGEILNPRSGDWLESMLPHELVHASHLAHIQGTSLQGFVSVFSPDFARAMHFTTPAGMTEGLAVQYESSITEHGGRLNYAHFNSQYNGWGLWSAITPAGVTNPADRHYIGGSHVVDFLMDQYGEETVSSLLRSHAAWPVFGFGWSLRRQTGKWSWQLDADYRRWLAAAPQRLSDDGAVFSHPQWIHADTLIAYGTFYRDRPGFHLLRTDGTGHELWFETSLTEDGLFRLDGARREVVYSRYRPHPRHSEQTLLVTEALRMDDRSVRLIAEGVYDVTVTPDTTYFLRPEDGPIQRVVPNPEKAGSLAVIAKRGRTQGLYLSDTGVADGGLIGNTLPAVLFRDGSVLDAKWHPDGRRLLITSDAGGELQLYEFDVDASSLSRLTNEPGGAFNGSYAPDGHRIAFVTMNGDSRPVRIRTVAELTPSVLPRELWDGESSDRAPDPAMGADIDASAWMAAPYRSGLRDLKPRTWFPMVGRMQSGVMLAGGDPLRRNAYNMSIGYGQDKPYYDLNIQTARVYPGVGLRSYRLPLSSGVGSKAVYAGDESMHQLIADLTHRFDTRARHTSIGASPFIGYTVVDQANGFRSEGIRAGVAVMGNYRLRQAARDPQPTAGLAAFVTAQGDLSYQESGPFLRRDPLRSLSGTAYAFTPWGIRLDAEAYLQNRPYFDLAALFDDRFNTRGLFDSDPDAVYAFGARYALPLAHPDTKWPLMPFYSERFYAVVFGKHVSSSSGDARAVVGGGLRFRGRVGPIGFDVGLGVAYVPTRDDLFVTTGF